MSQNTSILINSFNLEYKKTEMQEPVQMYKFKLKDLYETITQSLSETDEKLIYSLYTSMKDTIILKENEVIDQIEV